MHHLAATIRMLIGDIDLTVSDRHCAFVLAEALQQLQRRRRAARCLLPKERWREQACPPMQLCCLMDVTGEHTVPGVRLHAAMLPDGLCRGLSGAQMRGVQNSTTRV